MAASLRSVISGSISASRLLELVAGIAWQAADLHGGHFAGDAVLVGEVRPALVERVRRFVVAVGS